MGDIYKLKYNGRTLTYPGWNGYVAFEGPEPIVYDVILTTDGHGSITANPMSGSKDTLITLSNTPDQNYVFSKYTLNNVDLTGNTFLMPEADANVKGWFEADMRTITVTQPSHGTITAPGSAQVGSTVTLSISTDTGYALQYFTVNGSQIQGNSFVMPASNVTVSASIGMILYTISLTQPSHGVITAPATASYGSTVTLSSTPDSGYELQNYTLDGNPIVGNTFTMPAHDVIISAVFVAKAPTVDEVTIGNQTWMSKNLAIDDGQGGIYTQTVNYGQGDVTEYYYDLNAAIRVAASVQGWHLPSQDEWNTLINEIGGVTTAETKLKSTYGWSSGNGTDDYGFAVFPAGYRSTSSFLSLKTYARFWTSTSSGRQYYYTQFRTTSLTVTSSSNRTNGYSVRLIKDS